MRDPGMFWAVFGMAWVFSCVAVLIIVWNLRAKRRAEKDKLIHEERMAAIEKGVPLPEFPNLSEETDMDQFNKMRTSSSLNPRWPLGVGALCVFGGMGFIVAMLLSGDNELWKLWSMGMIGVFFGFGMMLFYRLTRTPEK